MRKMIMMAAAVSALAYAGPMAGAASAQARPADAGALRAALGNDDLRTTYVQWRGRYNGGPGWRGGPAYGRYGAYGRPYYYRRNYGGAAAAGALGLATGAIIGGAIAQQQQQAAPVYVQPGGGAYDYCAQRYRSYDPASGTYLGYDGLRHPCP